MLSRTEADAAETITFIKIHSFNISVARPLPSPLREPTAVQFETASYCTTATTTAAAAAGNNRKKHHLSYVINLALSPTR
jgi:hypothetical protein